jgi:enoyl-CoA hydratase/carnithine racemase
MAILTNIDSNCNPLVKTTIDNDSGVALLELRRHGKRNALSQALIDTLVAAIATVERNQMVRAVVLAGSAGSPFSGMLDKQAACTQCVHELAGHL